MGLSVQEFSCLTPAEFDAIYSEWRAGQEAEMQGKWERCRWICYYAVKPYATKTLHLTDILKFEWDESRGKGAKKMTKRQREASRKKIKKVIELWKDDDDE